MRCYAVRESIAQSQQHRVPARSAFASTLQATIKPMARNNAKNTVERKLDLLYLIFFIVHVPIMLLVDLYPLYPTFLRPEFLSTLRAFYIDMTKDQFFTRHVPFFTLYIWMELLYHLPLSIWAIVAIPRGM